MLARTYRLTDKFGVVLLKSTGAFGAYSARGVGIVLDAVGRVLSLLLAVIGVVLGIIARLLRGVLSLFAAVLRVFTRSAVVAGRQVSGSAQQVSGARMARRASQDAREDMIADVRVVEDPLRTQNRLLSALFLLTLVALISVVLWATNPGRSIDAGQAVTSGLSFVVPNATLNPTAPPLLSTAVPTATLLPSVLEARGSIAYVARENGQDDIWALNIGNRTPLRLTNSVEDDRDPSWSPDGQRLAFASRQDGNWELYIYDTPTGNVTRMTYDLSFQGAPHWSPDGLNLVYESYQGDNLDVYVVPIDGSQPAQRVTNHPAPDFSGVWSPDGRRIAFVSWRDGNQDVYVFSLDNPRDADSVNLTNTPTRQEDYPAWSPDGRFLAYCALDEGLEKVFVKATDNVQSPAHVIGQGCEPAWSPDGASIIYAVDSLEGTQFVAVPFADAGVATLVVGVNGSGSRPTWSGRPLPLALVNTGGLPAGAAQPLFIEQVSTTDENGLFRLGTLFSVDVSRSSPYLSDQVNDSFNALRERTLTNAGWDFLGQLDDAFWDLNRLPEPGEERRSWYMTGRAFGINRNLTAGFPSRIELVREDVGVETYWRLYVRVSEDEQSGGLGEPLRRMPWDMLSRNSGDVQAYDQGGRLKSQVPSGYYIDFTQLAADYGWLRAPTGNDWRANFNAINYWLFEKTDALDWYQAMRQLYTDAQLGGFAPTAVPQTAGS